MCVCGGALRIKFTGFLGVGKHTGGMVFFLCVTQKLGSSIDNQGQFVHSPRWQKQKQASSLKSRDAVIGGSLVIRGICNGH